MTQLLLLCSVLLWAAMFWPALCECNVALCQNKIPTNGTKPEQCTQARGAITCALSTLLNNPDCTENVKMIVREKVSEGRKQVQELCGGGAAGLLASIAVCLGLSGLTYFVTVLESRTS